MKPTFFPTPAAFRAWFERHHTTSRELLVGFYKEAPASRASPGRSPSIRHSASARSTAFGGASTRRGFHPLHTAQNASTWSSINVRRMKELTASGLMRPAGVEAFDRRSEDKSGIYSYEQRKSAKLPASRRSAVSGKREGLDVLPKPTSVVPRRPSIGSSAPKKRRRASGASRRSWPIRQAAERSVADPARTIELSHAASRAAHLVSGPPARAVRARHVRCAGSSE